MAQIEELLNMTNDSTKLSHVVGGLESQLQSFNRSGDPRPTSVGNAMHHPNQSDSANSVMMQSNQQPARSQHVTVQYVSQPAPNNSFPPSNVVIATSQPSRVVAGPRHQQTQQLPVTFIQGTQMIPQGVQSHAVHPVAVSSNQLRVATTANSGNVNRQMPVTSFPQNLPSNAVFQLNGQPVLLLPRTYVQTSGNSSQTQVISTSHRAIAPSEVVKQQPVMQHQPQQHSQQQISNTDSSDLANRGRKFLADLVSIAAKQNPQAGSKISRLIDEVKHGQKSAANFVSEVQVMFPIVVRSGDNSQSEIDQSTLVTMVHCAIAPGNMANRSSTPYNAQVRPAIHQGMVQRQQIPPQSQQQVSQIRIASGQSAVLVAGAPRPPNNIQQPQHLNQSALTPSPTPTMGSVPRPVVTRSAGQINMTPQPHTPQMQLQQPQHTTPQMHSHSQPNNFQSQKNVKMEIQDPEITDVTAMSGVDIDEESRAIMTSKAAAVPQVMPPATQSASRPGGTTQSPTRASREQPMLAAAPSRPTGSVLTRLNQIVASHGLSLPPPSSLSAQNEQATAVVNLLSLATQNYLKDFVEQMAVVCAHRLYNLKTDSGKYDQIGDTRIQLKAIEKVEQKMIDQCLMGGGLRSSSSNPTAADAANDDSSMGGASRVSGIAPDIGKGTDQESTRQREANAMAMAAIAGSRRWMHKKPESAATPNTNSNSASNQATGGGGEDSEALSAARGGQQQGPRARRATLSDVLFVLQQHPRLSRNASLIYKYSNYNAK